MLFSSTYKTIHITETSELGIVYKNKGSKFYAFVYEVKTENEVKKHLQQLKLRFPDASHHCYAYVLHYDQHLFRANDDGEPNNTAGKPILRQIQKRDLTNVLVVVVRYFGGTLLGVPGLIESYGAAADECLKTVEIIENEIYEIYELSCEYGNEQTVFSLVKQFQGSLIVKEKGNIFCAEIKIPLRLVEQFKQKTKDLFKIEIKYLGIS